MRNIIYTVASSQTATASTPLLVGTIVRRVGCAYATTANSIVIRKPGFYKVTVDATVTNSDSSAITEALNIEQSGTVVSGGTVTTAVASNASVGLSNSNVIKVGCTGAVIQALPTNTGATYASLSIIVEEV